MSVPLQRYRFTVDEYYRLAEAGILGEDDRVELIEGEIVMMSPVGGRHAACVGRLNRLLTRLAGDAAIVRVKDPIRLDDRSEPQPDLSLLRPRDDFYASGHPRPADVLLVIEVADATLPYDRSIKLPLYGRAGIVEVWIVDLGRNCIDTYTEPYSDGYAATRLYRPGESVPVAALAGSLPVDDVIPG